MYAPCNRRCHQGEYPDLCQSHIDVVRTEIARASGRAATIADVEKWTDDFRRAQGE
ncbi:terminase small subunit [Salmonella enterica]|nr:terminase small subunit [Salmonella enterica]